MKAFVSSSKKIRATPIWVIIGLTHILANPHIQDIEAQDEAEAEKIARDKFPSRDGFVVEQVKASQYFQAPLVEGA